MSNLYSGKVGLEKELIKDTAAAELTKTIVPILQKDQVEITPNVSAKPMRRI